MSKSGLAMAVGVTSALAVALALVAASAVAADTPARGPAPSVKMDTVSPPPDPRAKEPAATETAPAKKVLRPEDIKELPTFSKYDNESWEQLLQKGRALLSDVKDNTFEYDESAFYWLVAQVSKFPADQMKPGADATAYKILLAQPETHRGEIVTVSGVYLKVTPFHVPITALRKDVPMLYECTIGELPLTNDSILATVITTEDPMEYLQKDDEVRVKGYFYKIRTYQRADGSARPSPMLIAQRLEPMQAAVNQSVWAGVIADPWIMYAAGGLLFLFGGFLFLKMMTRPKSKYEPITDKNRVHRFRLRHPDFVPPPAGGGPRSPGDSPKP
jgi:hypothetical protein